LIYKVYALFRPISLSVPRHNRIFGSRAFPYLCPKNLDCKSLTAFRRNLQTHCIQSAFTTPIATQPQIFPYSNQKLVLYKSPTYLLTYLLTISVSLQSRILLQLRKKISVLLLLLFKILCNRCILYSMHFLPFFKLPFSCYFISANLSVFRMPYIVCLDFL